MTGRPLIIAPDHERVPRTPGPGKELGQRGQVGSGGEAPGTGSPLGLVPVPTASSSVSCQPTAGGASWTGPDFHALQPPWARGKGCHGATNGGCHWLTPSPKKRAPGGPGSPSTCPISPHSTPRARQHPLGSHSPPEAPGRTGRRPRVPPGTCSHTAPAQARARHTCGDGAPLGGCLPPRVPAPHCPRHAQTLQILAARGAQLRRQEHKGTLILEEKETPKD